MKSGDRQSRQWNNAAIAIVGRATWARPYLSRQGAQHVARPFRFGMQFMTLPPDWRSAISRYESLGVSRFTFHDHFFAAPEGPFAGLGAIAGVAAHAGVE